MKFLLISMIVVFLPGCTSAPNNKGVVTVNGTTFDDENWNGR